VIADGRKSEPTRVESTSDTAERIWLSIPDVLAARTSCNNIVDLKEVKPPTSSECI
jgi:hypothetical protein